MPIYFPIRWCSLPRIESQLTFSIFLCLSEQFLGEFAFLLENTFAKKSKAREILVGWICWQVWHNVFINTTLVLLQDSHFFLDSGVLCDSVWTKTTQTFRFKKPSILFLIFGFFWSNFSDFFKIWSRFMNFGQLITLLLLLPLCLIFLSSHKLGRRWSGWLDSRDLSNYFNYLISIINDYNSFLIFVVDQLWHWLTRQPQAQLLSMQWRILLRQSLTEIKQILNLLLTSCVPVRSH